jgi:hypothetical protein
MIHDDSDQCIVNIVYCSYCGISDKIIMLLDNMFCADVGETSFEHCDTNKCNRGAPSSECCRNMSQGSRPEFCN